LATIQAAQLPDINFIKGKNVEQQQLQSIMRLRELAVKQQTAISDQIKGLLLEFNVRVSTKNGGLRGAVQLFIEDAENALSFEFRESFNTPYEQYVLLVKSIKTYECCLEEIVAQHSECTKLLKLEGVGTINAVNLYIALGCADLGFFSKGKSASACIGLTPMQYFSGGKIKLGSTGKHVKNSLLRSQLITGAMPAVTQAAKRTAVTKKVPGYKL